VEQVPPRMLRYATVGKGRFELPTSRSRTAHSNLAELLPDARQDDTTRLQRFRSRRSRAIAVARVETSVRVSTKTHHKTCNKGGAWDRRSSTKAATNAALQSRPRAKHAERKRLE
jgi:hypothetical protein